MKSESNAGPPLMITTVLVVVVAAGAGLALGLGRASVLAAMIGLFCLIASLMGSLWPDLRRMAWLGPLAVVASTVPRFLGNWNYAAGVAALVLALFLISLLQAGGPRYRIATIGVSFAAIAGFGVALPDGSSDAAVFWAAVLGLAVALVLRILAGLADPDRHTREQLAAPLTAEEFDCAEVINTWLLDRPSTWSTGVLGGAFGYRRAIDTADHLSSALGPEEKAAADERIRAVRADADAAAALVVARRPLAAPPAAEVPIGDEPLPTTEPLPRRDPIAALLVEAREHLAEVRRHATERDRSARTELTPVRRQLNRARLGSAVRPETGALTDASTKAVGMTLAAASGLQIDQPAFANTYFNAVISMLQPSWAGTFQRVAYRILGCVVGIVLVVAADVYLPPAGMYFVALAGLFTLTWFITTRPIVSGAGGVAMSVALTSTGRHLDPLDTLVHLLIIVGAAVVIVLVVSIPSMVRAHRTSPQRQITGAVAGVSGVLADLAGSGPAPQYRTFVLGSAFSQRLRREAPGMTEPYRDIARRTAGLLDALVLITVIDRSSPRREISIPYLCALMDPAVDSGDVFVDDATGLGATAALCARQISRQLEELPEMTVPARLAPTD